MTETESVVAVGGAAAQASPDVVDTPTRASVSSTRSAALSAETAKAKIIAVPTGQQAEHNAAFIALFCRYAQPYLDYERPTECKKNQAFPLILLNCRWDHSFGFPGGKVDPGETLKQAAVREAKEEIGVVVREESLIPVCTYMREGGNFAAHLFAVEVTTAQLMAAVSSSWQAEDAVAEVLGVIVLRVDSQLVATATKGIVEFVRRTPMSFSARHELVTAVNVLELLGKDDVAVLRQALQENIDARN